ncbi:aromatic-ring-hydroxylating dioxygenase subunit beta [Verminephrobacter eiseniae]|uniref:Aromatic-ring-hydroxylating dioxygenase, beta subunit n=1 Tax=Verminephrobacter eiseniae (strain EF01-2) TaxID=391735 RepID=A1WJD9_VEREI|nr:aromatic-ring-hydroxylating dioxygenase subunit beta [Verminephrobacter eiseniae]ABM57746.1 aromatic-ring-hydroxylating dioxygenase, beta subunit [Verminephrobacter eiseniae EF01-2]MCW5283359.1 aromatic-ring-hydroxylating dioxygenase subunit beta [Verminephrobacter eiseniae]MCW5301068.1 aromatic-ring-hydroxylating dioxygenase subunit beta [Verminephrobacter eiseniae]MCW8180292.1 aromatic-ring-hydroxylating dioxygenase subunit beta [Verminephrobacter eiseniae]MCW8192518.1 aromatic-ring-hydro
MLLETDFDVSTADLRPVAWSLEQQHRLQQFLFAEARLLDERRLTDWLNLWTDDGMYWVPQAQQQDNPYDHISLAWEDRMLREIRVRRLSDARNWSQQPATHTTRMVGNISAAGLDGADNLVAHSVFQMSEWRNIRDMPLHQVAGRITHKLASHGDTWRIRLKRVDLVNCDAVHGMLQAFF